MQAPLLPQRDFEISALQQELQQQFDTKSLSTDNAMKRFAPNSVLFQHTICDNKKCGCVTIRIVCNVSVCVL
jgi:hypothetical protein